MKKTVALAALLIGTTTMAWAEPVTLRLGHAVFEAHPNHDTAVRFKEAVERLSGGDVTINIFPARQLGDVKELMEGVQFGTVDMTVNSSSALATLEPSIDAFQLPGVIPDYAGFAKLALSAPARAIMDTVANHDMVALGLYDGGQRHFLTVKEPVTSMESLTGLKTRVAPVKLFLDVWAAAGVNPTPMAYGEVYSALETGTLDAVEINLTSIESEKYYEVAGGVTLTGHYFWPSFLLINKGIFEGLTPEQQKAMRDAAAEITEPQVMAVAALDETVKAHLAELKVPVVEPSAEFLAAFRAATAPVVEAYKAADPRIAAFVDEAASLSPTQN
ncbi:TRAP transporter substrate-binding protein (plasmid) [Gemmobacter fulvus]|uniref:TRAP transporter substrate-binding protein n=1 Tax=Gemmobacter fulvus TaxID=2840474 RepID=A0A975PA01_9RHOB|nr:TRAP transporter substrate-binding protein [Gemmobacter fulvus]MBT9246245.1 TRAP transporter substrate-binding protein [Gemmobacter fulvus]MDQ1850208.1 TRAP transporter substrate-binding protein [Gemmobacter fulvus]QWK92399.1 TRAP transporter substrate-binding protein [Gemmobacter fulvus]